MAVISFKQALAVAQAALFFGNATARKIYLPGREFNSGQSIRP